MIKMWLDDVRDPSKFGAIGWEWVKTAPDAIELLKTGTVEQASLDHDLEWSHYPGVSPLGIQYHTGTGYDVVLFLEENPQFLPPLGTSVHSMNPVGKERMKRVLDRLYA